MIKILIVDDHPLFRVGVKSIIEQAPSMKVTDEASTGEEALNKISENSFDIVLLDISMPDKDGLDILQQIKEEKADLPVLMLSMYTEEEYALSALQKGASGYLTKESAPMELVKALRSVASGKKYITSSLAQLLVSYLKDIPMKKPHEDLSHREYQIMIMIALGKKLTEIAQELSLSTSTISTFRARIMDKMNMKNNAELINYVRRNRLID